MRRGEAKAWKVLANPASHPADVSFARAFLDWLIARGRSSHCPLPHGGDLFLRIERGCAILSDRKPGEPAGLQDPAVASLTPAWKEIILSGELLPAEAADDRPVDDRSPPWPVLIARAVLTAAPPARVPDPAGAAG
jgi:hypothetical protein